MTLPKYVSRNGMLVMPDEACVSVFNPAIHGAFGIYEAMQIARGVVFAMQAHLVRLARSASLLGMPLPGRLPDFETWIREIVAANQVADSTLRLFVVGAENGSETVAYMWPQPPVRYSTVLYDRGASAVTFEGQRFMPEAKSLNTLVSFMATNRAKAVGAHEALLYHDGCLTEGASSNLFAVIDDTVVTPPAEQVLSGVTRDILMMLGPDHGFAIREASLMRSDVSSWAECFITSTSRHIMPVTSIDGVKIGPGETGPVTRRLMDSFEECFLRQTCPAK